MTLGSGNAYEVNNLLDGLRLVDVTPCIARNELPRRKSTFDAWTTGYDGCAVSERKGKQVEENSRWAKLIGGLRKTRYRRPPRAGPRALFIGAAQEPAAEDDANGRRLADV